MASRSSKNQTSSRNSVKKTPELTRLNKFISDSGLCSRRKADELIEEGSVTLNGKKVFEHGVRIDPQKDSIKVSGKLIQSKGKNVYFILNKPKNVVTTMSDPEGRPTVAEYVKTKARVFPVGRLDWDTEGLLILTNDGKFSQEVTHPSKDIPKTYLAKLDGQPDQEKLNKLKNGVNIVGGRVSATKIERVQRGSSNKYDWVKITITEGKNRQVRKMFEKIGYSVQKLKRVSIGELKLGQLKKGEVRQLTFAEVARVFVKKEEKTADGKPKKKVKRKVSEKRVPAKKKTKKKTSASKRLRRG